MPTEKDLDNKRVVVVGGSSGVGFGPSPRRRHCRGAEGHHRLQQRRKSSGKPFNPSARKCPWRGG